VCVCVCLFIVYACVYVYVYVYVCMGMRMHIYMYLHVAVRDALDHLLAYIFRCVHLSHSKHSGQRESERDEKQSHLLELTLCLKPKLVCVSVHHVLKAT
jgi:hypothetical protein